MARPAGGSKLQQLAEEQGKPLSELIPNAIEQEGSIFRAALTLGVTPNSIQYWLKKNNLQLKQTVKVVPQKLELMGA